MSAAVCYAPAGRKGPKTMTSDVIQPVGIRQVAVIGLGLMGSGIAELVRLPIVTGV